MRTTGWWRWMSSWNFVQSSRACFSLIVQNFEHFVPVRALKQGCLFGMRTSALTQEQSKEPAWLVSQEQSKEPAWLVSLKPGQFALCWLRFFDSCWLCCIPLWLKVASLAQRKAWGHLHLFLSGAKLARPTSFGLIAPWPRVAQVSLQIMLTHMPVGLLLRQRRIGWRAGQFVLDA